MKLSPDETELFYTTWFALLQWVNDQRNVLPGVVLRRDGSNGPDQLLALRAALWSDAALLDEFVTRNPAGLTPIGLALAASWKQRREGTFIVFRQLQKYAVVIDDTKTEQVYAVLGLVNPIEELLPWMPCVVKAVMLPFHDRIILDGLIETYSIRLGPGIRRRLEGIYRAAKGRVVTSLVPADAARSPAAKKKGATAKKKAAPRDAKGAAEEKVLQHPGRCEGCGEVFSKRSIGRHIVSCETLNALPKKAKPVTAFRLVVESPGMPEYWLHLDVPKGTTLKKIDDFLRDLWLECCGHLSAFTIGGQTFASNPTDDGWSDTRERSLSAKVETLVAYTPWRYEYDFGTTTQLRVRLTGTHQGRGGAVRLMARNLPPEWACGACGAPATLVCAQCRWEGGGGVCEKCAPAHRCGEDAMLPLVNSPRVGMCGYTG